MEYNVGDTVTVRTVQGITGTGTITGVYGAHCVEDDVYDVDGFFPGAPLLVHADEIISVR